MLLHSSTLILLMMVLMNFRAFSVFQYSLFFFAVLLISLHFLPEPWQAVLEYHRAEPAQIWRLLTGHLLHSNHWHLVMNLGALWLILLLHQMHYRLSSFVFLLVTGCLGISLLLYLYSPDIQIYVGLSGWLHCLISTGALFDIKHKIQSGWLILFGVAAKVAYEQWQGPDAALAELIQAHVATDAHLYGVICGLLLGLWLISRPGAAPLENQARRENAGAAPSVDE